jgi:branched-chain amino acid transport system permease protein
LLYSGIALALSVVFQGTGVLNFGQGVMAAFSAYLGWSFISFGLNFWWALVAAVILSFFLGAAVEMILMRPVVNASIMVRLIASVALLIAVQAAIGIIWGEVPKRIDSPFGGGAIHVGEVVISAQQLGSGALVLASVAAVAIFFKYTTTGLRMKAVAQNPASSRLLGINVGIMLSGSWGLAAAVGAVAGIAFAPTIGVAPDTMDGTLLLALSAITLGGMTSRWGAIMGGLIIGVATNLGGRYIPGLQELQLLVPFAIILIILLVRPEGLFGQKSSVRA